MRILMCSNERMQLVDICGMYSHPTGMLDAIPDRLLAEGDILEVDTLPIVIKDHITLEQYVCQNDRLQD